MKIFAIRDEGDKAQKDLAYLLYYEMEKRFYIELPEDADPWETPLLLASFAKRGEKTVNSYWSKLWVQQRIVPLDRQNLGQVLKDNRLNEYDEYSLLMLSMGRCAQDDYYLVPMDKGDLPNEIQSRFQKRIEDVVPLADYHLLVFFRDGKVKKCSLREHFQADNTFGVLLHQEDLFYPVQMQTGGHGVAWDTNMVISDAQLYEMGQNVPLSAGDFQNFVVHRVITAAEAAEILGCSRQNIDDLTKRGKLHPLKSSAKTTLFLKSEVLKRNWQ
jgi:hypothetical protein